MDEKLLRDAAMDYHRAPAAGKISVTPTKGLTNQHDLALAYSPGVAYACLAIRENPQEAANLTSRSNLVAVVTNGTAVLGLGNWWEEEQARHASGWCREPSACQHLHEPVPEALASKRMWRSIPRSCRLLCRRLRHPQPRSCGRGAGVDEGGDDQAWANAQ